MGYRRITKKSWLSWFKVGKELKSKLCTVMGMISWESSWQTKLYRPTTSNISPYCRFWRNSVLTKSGNMNLVLANLFNPPKAGERIFSIFFSHPITELSKTKKKIFSTLSLNCTKQKRRKEEWLNKTKTTMEECL